MKKINSANAPEAIGPYSHAILVDSGPLLFLSGQMPLDPFSMQVVSSDVEEQTMQVMKNLAAVLQEAGLLLDDIVKVTIFLTDMNDFALVNSVYEQALNGHNPARATVEVSRLPKDVKVEIEAVARVRPSK